jgi:hypothetical protein
VAHIMFHSMLHVMPAILPGTRGFCCGVVVSGDRTMVARTACACAGRESDGGNVRIEERQSEQADHGGKPSLRNNVPIWIQPEHTKSFAYPNHHTPGSAIWMYERQKVHLSPVLIRIGSSHRVGLSLTWRGASGRLA